MSEKVKVALYPPLRCPHSGGCPNAERYKKLEENRPKNRTAAINEKIHLYLGRRDILGDIVVAHEEAVAACNEWDRSDKTRRAFLGGPPVRNKPRKASKPTSLMIPEDIKERLDKISADTNVSINTVLVAIYEDIILNPDRFDNPDKPIV